MVRKRYKKPYRAKRKKPFYGKFSFWFFALFLVFGSGLIWLLCFSSVFEVKSVQVAGDGVTKNGQCQKIIETMAEKKIAFLQTKSIFLLDLNKAGKEILNEFPQIKNVSIVRKFPGEIYAQVEERQPAAVLNWRDASFYYLDETGVAYDTAADFQNYFQIRQNDESKEVKLGVKVFDPAFMVKILRLRAGFESDAQIKMASALAVTDERVNFRTPEGWEIYTNPQKDLDWQIAKLKAVAADPSFESKKSNLEYIDLRFTRVYLKTKQVDGSATGQEQGQSSQTQNSGGTVPPAPVDPTKPLN